MSGHESNAQLIQRLRAARSEWDAAVAAAPRRDGTSATSGKWLVKEIIFHLTGGMATGHGLETHRLGRRSHSVTQTPLGRHSLEVGLLRW